MSGQYYKVPLLLLLLFFFMDTTEAGYPLKILGIFPHPGLSHFYFFHPIMRGLAEAGHDVTVISHFPDKSPAVRYKDLPLSGIETLSESVDLEIFEQNRFYNHFIEFFILKEYGIKSCNLTLRSSALAQVLRQKDHFDVIILEQFNTDCLMAVAHILKAPVIALSSCPMMPWHYERMGLPIIPSYMPALFVGLSDEMSFSERVGNWISFHGLRLLYKFLTVPADDALVQYKFGHDMPSVGELAKETSLYFVNQHFSLSGAKPLPPSVIELGGIHIQKAKPLDAELQRYLDNSQHGVIYISWGHMIRANSMSIEKREGLLRAIRRLKQNVIWKFENETIENKPDNLYISNWLPQREILCHPNVKVFMTHAGLMGSSEAAYCGVPVIATPFYGDQFLNAAAFQKRGMGNILHYSDVTENNVYKAIKKVLEKQYMDNAKLVSHSFHHRPQTALQTAIWWVEYAARTEGAPLTKSASVYMSRFTYYSFDVYLLLGSILGLSAWIIYQICFKFCSCRQGQEKVKRN